MATWELILIGVGVVLTVGLLAAWGIGRLQWRGRRDERAVDLQQRIAEPISRDPRLANAAILPTAVLRGGGETTVVITGQVESEQARRRVLDIACRVAPAATLVDHLDIVPRDRQNAG